MFWLFILTSIKALNFDSIFQNLVSFGPQTTLKEDPDFNVCLCCVYHQDLKVNSLSDPRLKVDS